MRRTVCGGGAESWCLPPPSGNGLELLEVQILMFCNLNPGQGGLIRSAAAVLS